MDASDLVKVAKIMLTADCWCVNCASDLFAELRAAYPGQTPLIDATWARRTEIEMKYREQQKLTWDSPDMPKPQVWEF